MSPEKLWLEKILVTKKEMLKKYLGSENILDAKPKVLPTKLNSFDLSLVVDIGSKNTHCWRTILATLIVSQPPGLLAFPSESH